MFGKKIKISKTEYNFLKSKSNLLDRIMDDLEKHNEKFSKYNKDTQFIMKQQDAVINEFENGRISISEYNYKMKILSGKLDSLNDMFAPGWKNDELGGTN